MPGWFVVAIVFAVLSVIAMLVNRATKAHPERQRDYVDSEEHLHDVEVVHRSAPKVAIAFGVLSILCLLVSSYNPVNTKEEGVVTSFNKPVGQLGAGLHFTWPWQKVHEMDAAVQTDSYSGTNCLQVRIANQQTGCAPISIQWRIVPEHVDTLYQDYRSFEHVRDALVTRRLTKATNQVLATYNPLDSINGASRETLVTLANRIKTELASEVGGTAAAVADRRIEVLSVLMPIIRFDPATQDRINQLQQQVALTRQATQEKLTNIQKALANRNLAKSVDTSPNVLVARCFDLLDQVVKADQAIPAGFSCWPGGSGVGVFVQGDKAKAATP